MGSGIHKYKSDADWIDSAVTEPTRPMRGMKTVLEALQEEDFPMDRSALDYSVGDIEVEDGKGGYIPVYQLTDRFPPETGDLFESPEEVLQALRQSLESLGKPRPKRAASRAA